MTEGSASPILLLTGATSQVGLFALPRLLSAGFQTIALSRKCHRGTPAPAPGSRRELLWLHPDQVLPPAIDDMRQSENQPICGVEALLSLGPLGLASSLAPQCPKLRRIVCLSTSSIYTKMSSPDKSERVQLGEIQTAENRLRLYCIQRDISLFLLRPTLIYGCGLDQNVSRIARLIRRWRFIPLAGRAAGLRQPVHADDLAALCVAVLTSDSKAGIESPVGGGSVLSYHAMVERIFTAQGLVPRILHLPPPLLAGLLRSLSWLPGLDGLNPEFAWRQNRNFVFDDSRLRELFEFRPRPFDPGPDDFKVPESARALQPGSAHRP